MLSNKTHEPSRLSVAPMMAWTDRHCRTLHRYFTPNGLLFTEMVTANALQNGPAERLLRHARVPHPTALQLGGNNPVSLAIAAKMGADSGYAEINLNVGCPSDRVQNGAFGACLMRDPQLVADCVRAMVEVVDVPVTVKCRIGVDNLDSDEFLFRFVAAVAEAGCRRFYVHARIAILSGLSPAQNRQIPPLNYARVTRLGKHFPKLQLVLNGGLTSKHQCAALWPNFHGLMIGRAAYHNPRLLHELDQWMFETETPDSKTSDSYTSDSGLSTLGWWAAAQYIAYMREEVDAGTPLSNMTRHMLGLFNGQPGARQFRRALSDANRLKQEGIKLVEDALNRLQERNPTWSLEVAN